MRRLTRAWRVALATSLMVSIAQAEARWTLADAVAQALAASPEAGIAAARVDAAAALVAEADARRLPQLDVRVSYLQTTQPMQAFGSILNQGTFDNGINFNAPGQIDAFSAGLHGRLPLYSGGQVRAQRAAARAGGTAATHEAEAARRGLALEVIRTYFAIRAAEDSVVAFESALTSYQEALRVGRLREQAGDLLATERLNLDVQHAQTAQELLAARHAATLHARRLGVLMGRSAEAPILLAGEDPTLARIAEPVRGTSPSTRPERLALQEAVAAAEQQIRAARGARQPSVAGFASAQTDHGWRRDGSGESWTVGVAADWAVFDGHAARSRLRHAEARARLVREQLRQAELTLSWEHEQARLAHALAREQLAVATRAVEQAGESARLSRERFAAGALLSAELIGVETRLAEAAVRRSQLEGLERTSLATLRVTLGLPPLE